MHCTMEIKKTIISSVDDYIARFDKPIQLRLKAMRKAIKKAAPKAEEYIGYQMPAYKYCGMLVYFAAYKNHIGFYPTGSSLEKLKSKVKAYKTSKGTLQFKHDEDFPIDLIHEIVVYRVKENETKKLLKTTKSKK